MAPSQPGADPRLMSRSVATPFRVVAIIAAHNEEDIVGQAVAHLVREGVEVYFLDHGSSDETVKEVEPFLGKGLVHIERFPADSGRIVPEGFAWSAILRRKEELAAELDADWFIHHDADEFRESPWAECSLRDAIHRVDQFGYNAIDWEVLNFWPVDDSFTRGRDVAEAFRYYDEAAPFDRLQVKCWRKTAHPVDLVSEGGHDASFPDRRVFPIRFLLRHYPIRSQLHGERKVFRERRARVLPEERAKGWHLQYDHVTEGQVFLRQPSELKLYDPDAVRLSLMLRHRGVERLEAELALRDAAVGQLQSALVGAQSEGRRLRDERERLDLEVRRLLDQADEQTRIIARLGEAMDAKAAEKAASDRRAESLAADIARLNRRVEALVASASWRWTAPLRRVYELFQRHK